MTQDHTSSHEPLCRTTYKALTPSTTCRDCDLLREQRQRLAAHLRTLAPLCREPAVAWSSGSCSCWNGLITAINVIEKGNP